MGPPAVVAEKALRLINRKNVETFDVDEWIAISVELCRIRHDSAGGGALRDAKVSVCDTRHTHARVRKRKRKKEGLRYTSHARTRTQEERRTPGGEETIT